MTILPKYSKVYLVESTSGDPYLGGPLEVRLSADGVSIRWAGEETWKEIAWFEIAVCAEAPGQYRDVIDAWKAQAFEEGLRDGVQTVPEPDAILNYVEQLKESRQAPNPPTSPRAG